MPFNVNDWQILLNSIFRVIESVSVYVICTYVTYRRTTREVSSTVHSGTSTYYTCSSNRY